MIRKKKTTIFTDAKDNTTVQELKKMIEGRLMIFFFFLLISPKIVFKQIKFIFQEFLKLNLKIKFYITKIVCLWKMIRPYWIME